MIGGVAVADHAGPSFQDKKADLVPAVLPFALNPKLKEKAKSSSNNGKPSA